MIHGLSASMKRHRRSCSRSRRIDFSARAAPSTSKHAATRRIERMRIEVERVNWLSTDHVHHRVDARFEGGRAFLLATPPTFTVLWTYEKGNFIVRIPV